uniref:Uncharacterized protein n=1 Tax=Pararge aegeria TaxID=116150 RepID=S4NHT6_9NEOP
MVIHDKSSSFKLIRFCETLIFLLFSLLVLRAERLNYCQALIFHSLKNICLIGKLFVPDLHLFQFFNLCRYVSSDE